MTSPMPVSPRLAFLLPLGLLAAGLASPAPAADQPRAACLNKTEQRQAVANHRAIPLSQAVKIAERRGPRAELLRARLCGRGDGFVYELTLLSAKGKVRHAIVDAANGKLIKSH